jgi:hypothetical protein
MKNILCFIAITLTLLTLAACGGGGGGGGGTPDAAGGQSQPTSTSSSVTFTIQLTGILPANTAISGATCILALPANVTPAMVSSVVATSVLSYSGTFAGSTAAPIVTYTAATASTPGALSVVLTNTVSAGVTQVGEVATVTLQLANGASPTVASFGASSVTVYDVRGAIINGKGATVTNVTLK